jgi:protein phosphatase
MKVLFFSDVHANMYALKEILKVDCDKAIFLGDMVDYGTSPVETVEKIREIADYAVMGNHDYAAAFNKDCLCSQENHELSVFTRENITLKELGKNELNYLQKLPDYMEIDLDGVQFNLVHGSPTDHLYGYLYPWKLSAAMFTSLTGRSIDEGTFVVGHTHHQFLLSFGHIRIINPGSAGQPRDDSPYPSYVVYDSKKQSFEMNRFRYDTSAFKKELLEKVSDEFHRKKLIELFRLT